MTAAAKRMSSVTWVPPGMARAVMARPAAYYRQALVLFREQGSRPREIKALNRLGAALLADGQPADALTQHTYALNLAGQAGSRSTDVARAHDGLAHAYHAAGDPDRARHHWREALKLYAALDVPEAGQVRAQLTGPASLSPGRPRGKSHRNTSP